MYILCGSGLAKRRQGALAPIGYIGTQGGRGHLLLLSHRKAQGTLLFLFLFILLFLFIFIGPVRGPVHLFYNSVIFIKLRLFLDFVIYLFYLNIFYLYQVIPL